MQKVKQISRMWKTKLLYFVKVKTGSQPKQFTKIYKIVDILYEYMYNI